MNKKKIFLASIIWSVLLIVLFSKPRLVNWLDYGEARYYIMWASWLIWMIIMTWQVILWIRPMFNWFTKDFFWINWLHKRLGIWTLMALIFHPIASVISYGTSWLYIFSLDFSNFTEWRISIWKIAFDLILIVLATSIISRKFLSYRKWHWIHFLSYPAFIWVRFHGRFTWTMMSELPLVRWYWIVIWIILIIAIATRLAYQFWFLKLKSKILSHIQKTKDIFELQILLPKDIPYSEGQFVYLQDKIWWESHPFTILSYDKDTKMLRIAYKVYGKFTQWLSQTQEWTLLYIDWPYWIFMEDIPSQSQPIVCIAAWIWITPFYQIISNYSTTKDIKLLYLNKRKSDAVYEDELEQYLHEDCIHILSRETQSYRKNEITNTRISSHILQEQLWELLQTANFYLCWWWAVITSITQMLVDLWVDRKRIDYEPFTM